MNLVKATEAREAFLNLASLYGYEASLSIPPIGESIGTDGRYLMPAALKFADGEAEAYVVMSGEHAVGICGFTERADGSHMLDEIFAVKAFRTPEFFEAVLAPYLAGKQGVFQCHILKAQADVQELFEAYFAERGMAVQKEELDAMAWLCTVQL